MKKSLLLLIPSLLLLTGCQNDCNIAESTFFLVMTNIQYYPEEYVNKNITLDCFTYNVKAGICDLTGKLCGEKKTFSGKVGAYSSVSLFVFGEAVPENAFMYAKGEIGDNAYQTADNK